MSILEGAPRRAPTGLSPTSADIDVPDLLLSVEPALRNFWHPVAMSAEITDAPHAVTLLGERFVLVRWDGQVRAFVDRCPHRWFPLSEGAVVDGTLECPYHGYRFAADGRCVLVPARGAGAPIPEKANLTAVWGVTERYGIVWLAPDEPLADVVEVPEWDDPTLGRVPVGPLRWNVAAALAADNFLDVSHFPFVHSGTFGDPADTVVPEFSLTRSDWNFEFTYRHRALNPDDVKELHGSASDEQDRVMHFRYVPPFTIVTSVRYLTTGVLDVVLVSASPEGPRRCRIYSMLIGSDAAIDPIGAQEYEEKIIQEDQLLLEKYPDDGMPLGASAQFHSRADRMTVEYRRILTDIVRRHRELIERTAGLPTAPGPGR